MINNNLLFIVLAASSELQHSFIVDDSIRIGILLNNAMHLGKKLLAAILSIIVCCE